MSEVLGEPVEWLTDEELAAELTIAAYEPVRRSERFDERLTETTRRRRGQAALVILPAKTHGGRGELLRSAQ